MPVPSRPVPLGTLLISLATLAASAAVAQNQTPPANNGTSATANAQASGQGSVNANRTGATAQGSAQGSTAATAQSPMTPATSTQSDSKSAATQSTTTPSKGTHAAYAGESLANGSSVNAVLTKPVDSKRSKPGDAVTARTTQASSTEGGTSIPKGSTLMGHVTEAQAKDQSHAGSSLGIMFDKAVTKDGHEIPLANVGIQSLAAAEANAAGSVGEMGMPSAQGGGMGGGRPGGGGLVGHATGAIGGTVGAAGGAAQGAGSVAGGATGMLQAAPGSVGHVDATGMVGSQSHGVFGLPGMNLSSDTSEAAMGSVITSSGKSVHLDQGTRLLLSSGASATSGSTTHQAPAKGAGDAKPSAEKPGGPKSSSMEKPER